MRDTLFLIAPPFVDPDYSGLEPPCADQSYYCPYCASLEGVLAMFPQIAAELDVVRVPFERPRRALIDLIGEQNQGLPKLVLSEDAPDELAYGRHGNVRFVTGYENIMRALSKRLNLPYPHF